MKFHPPVHYKHDVKVYVPVFAVYPPHSASPTFEYSMANATQDLQMAESFNPDYILTLTGTFDATTKEFKEMEPKDLNDIVELIKNTLGRPLSAEEMADINKRLTPNEG